MLNTGVGYTRCDIWGWDLNQSLKDAELNQMLNIGAISESKYREGGGINQMLTIWG